MLLSEVGGPWAQLRDRGAVQSGIGTGLMEDPEAMPTARDALGTGWVQAARTVSQDVQEREGIHS